MENDLEQLLNSLVEKGWKPFGYNTIDNILIEGDNYKFISKGCYSFITNIRLLVSKESGLWQFVCENGMINDNKQYSFIKRSWKGRTDERNQKSYKYWLIESSLKDESELEDFLLNSIKVD